MSVTMAYMSENNIYLCADNRRSNPEDGSFCDDVTKIVVLNDHLAVACSGYYGVQLLFEKLVNEYKEQIDFRAEDVIFRFKTIYRMHKYSLSSKKRRGFKEIVARFLIAGKDRNDQDCLVVMSFLKGVLEGPHAIQKIILPPTDDCVEDCKRIFVQNLHSGDRSCFQKTVKEVSKISPAVSPSGDIWIFDRKNGCSTMQHFE
ncbi:MAG: hypothetical protein J6C84_00975 [Lachnospiraceae bacterium]|nr:hypothetical protein [Lachnospiraceae bacterium]